MSNKRKRPPGLRDAIIAIAAVILAITVGGSIGLMRQTHNKGTDQEQIEKLQRDREQHIKSGLTRYKLTPETIESDQLLYYEGLRLLLHRQHDRSAAFFEILPKRFPASPYIAKAKKLEPYALAASVIGTASKTNEIRSCTTPVEGSAISPAQAMAEIAIESLPLLTSQIYRIGTPPMYGSTPISNVTSCPWWVYADMQEVVYAPPDSPYALWPIGFGDSESPQPYQTEVREDILHTLGMQEHPRIAGYTLQPTPIDILLGMGTTAVPYLLDHLDDPRLTGVVLADRYFRPAPAGRTCFEILCQIAGFSFLDADPDLQSKLASHGLEVKNIDRAHPDMIELTPHIRDYIQAWWHDCAETTQTESILWHVDQLPSNDSRKIDYLVAAAAKGARKEALISIKKLHNPDDPEHELLIASALARLGDTTLVDSIFEKSMKGIGDNPFYGVNFITRYGMAEQKRKIIGKLLDQCDIDDPLLTFQTFTYLIPMGDITLLPDLARHFENGAFSALEDKEELIISWVNIYGSYEHQRAILNRIQAMLESAMPQELSSSESGTARNQEYTPVVTRAFDLAVHFSQQCEMYLAAEALAMFLQFRGSAREEDTNTEQRSQSNILPIRVCDEAALAITRKRLADIDFQYSLPTSERDQRIQEILQLLLETYPLIAKNPHIDSTQ